MSWETNLEEMFDLVEALDEEAEKQDMNPITREEILVIHMALLRLKERTSGA